MNRVAVQAGGAWLRVASDDGLVAAVPAGAADVATVLAGLFDTPADEVVVVHAAATPPDPTVGRALWPATTVRAVPAPVAALAGAADPVGPAAVGSDVVVVDVGHRGAEVTRVTAGRVVTGRPVGVGGARLDALTAELLTAVGGAARPAGARHVRETLSLLPVAPTGSPPVPVAAPALDTALAAPLAELVDAVRAVVAHGPGPPPPVLLVGGVARAPLLAELLDAAGIGDVRVAERPDTVAVTGALRVPPTAAPEVPRPAAPAGPPGAAGRVGAPPGRAPDAPVPRWLLPLDTRPGRGRRAVGGVAAAAAAVLALLAAGLVPSAPPPAPATGELVQYGYAVALPAGWVHTGGLPERRRSLLTPVAAPDGSDLISVERTPLGYDAGAEPARARAELRVTYAAAVAGGAGLSGFDDAARYAGRAVVVYREAGGASAADVEWYVVLDGDAQLSVGCRHTRAGAAAVGAACATVVGSLRRVP